MRILLATLDAAGHEAPASVLVQILKNAGHSITWKRFRCQDNSTTSLAEWFLRFQKLIPTEKLVLSTLIPQHDLLITDMTMFAGIELYNSYKIPWIQFGCNPIMHTNPEIPCIMQASTPFLEPFFRKHPRVHFVGPLVPRVKDFIPPFWWKSLLYTTKKVIHVTQGTIDCDQTKLIEPCQRAFHPESPFFLVTERVPHSILLKHVDVFITNGGFGGVCAAIEAGVPMVIAGENEDHGWIAQLVENAGLGINLSTERPAINRLKEAVQEILENPKYRRRAKLLAKIAKPRISKICQLVREAVQIQKSPGNPTKEAKPANHRVRRETVGLDNCSTVFSDSSVSA